jgi:hypothetical protein
MASKGQSGLKSVEVDPCQVRSTALGAFKRTHGHTQRAAVERSVTPPKLALANQVESLAVYLVKPRMVNRQPPL